MMLSLLTGVGWDHLGGQMKIREVLPLVALPNKTTDENRTVLYVDVVSW